MATSLAAMTARRAASLARLSPSISPATRASSLIPRRGLAGAADPHETPRINIWEDPMSPSKWKEEHFVIASLTGWFVVIYGSYKFLTRGKNDNAEEKVVEAPQK